MKLKVNHATFNCSSEYQVFTEELSLYTAYANGSHWICPLWIDNRTREFLIRPLILLVCDF